MADNTVLNNGAGGDTIRDLARQAGTIKTQVVQIDIGGASANAEVLVTAGQQVMAASLPVVIASNQSALLVQQAALTKGLQGANGVSTQNLKDAGRNQTNYFMAAQVISTAAEVLQSLTGYKSGAAVGATTTPAVVTANKIYRINSITITYIGVATAGAIEVNLRANTGGVVALASPLVCSWLVGEAEAATASVAGGAQTITIPFPDGLEFAAGTGIGIGVIGRGVTGAAAITGYAKVAVNGFEY